MNTEAKIKIMQAFVDGEEVETSQKTSIERWLPLNVENPIWNWNLIGYRIKPKPKEVWVNEYKDGPFAHDTEKTALIRSIDNDAVRRAVLYREVIE